MEMEEKSYESPQVSPERQPNEISDYPADGFSAARMPGFDQILSDDGDDSQTKQAEPTKSNEFVKDMVSMLSKAGQTKSDGIVPSFGLAGGILSAERQFASMSRTKKKSAAAAPSKSAQNDSLADSATLPEHSAPPQSPQHRIISEIVAKDIIARVGM